MIVAVLAGGRATRLGGAKATAMLAGRPLLCHALAAAREAGLEAVVVAKPATVLPAVEELVLREPQDPTHPLRGVLTALDFAAERCAAQAVVLRGCDMPFVTATLLGWLAGLEGRVMVEVGGRAQPLLSRVLVSDRPALTNALEQGRSLTAALDALAPRMLDEADLAPFGSPERLCFNVNDQHDLRLAAEVLA